MIFAGQHGLALANFSSNGDHTIIANTQMSGREHNFNLASGTTEIKVEAVGNSYSVYVDGRFIKDFQIPESPTQGIVGLYFQTSWQSSSAEWYTARFDEIRIEAID